MSGHAGVSSAVGAPHPGLSSAAWVGPLDVEALHLLPRTASTASLPQLELYPGELAAARAVGAELAVAKPPASQDPAPLWGVGPEDAAAFKARGVMVPVAAIEPDVGLVHGQPRPLDDRHVAEVVEWLRGNPPFQPLHDILLLAMDLAGSRYVVLGGAAPRAGPPGPAA